MMKFFALVLVLFSSSVFADDYRHQVSMGRNGLGWSGSYESMDTNSRSSFGSVTRIFTDLGINYAYRFNRFQVGAFYQKTSDEHDFKGRGSGSAPVLVETETYGIFTLYNFSDDISSAWFAGLSIGLHKYTEEISKDFSDAENKAAFELDDSGATYEVLVGKRFSLEKWEIKHITFAPMASIFGKSHGKDFDDQEVESGIGLSLQPIRFDVLF